jgi:hypothetical protein
VVIRQPELVFFQQSQPFSIEDPGLAKPTLPLSMTCRA